MNSWCSVPCLRLFWAGVTQLFLGAVKVYYLGSCTRILDHEEGDHLMEKIYLMDSQRLARGLIPPCNVTIFWLLMIIK